MNANPVDILAVGVHPDDVELSCSGTILKHIKSGRTCAVVDLTRGELGSRGTPEKRAQEAAKAAEIMNLKDRVNLGLADGFFEINREATRKIMEVIRYFRPKILLCNAPDDRHPDHGRAAKLVNEAAFYSGLIKIQTVYQGQEQLPHRPTAVYHYIQDRYLKPDFVVDISDEWEQKMECIQAYDSQFYIPGKENNEPQTPISGKEFIDFLRSRAVQFGRSIQRPYAEGFIAARTPGVNDLFDLV